MQLVHTVFPHFASRDNHGHPEQQDAGECWTELLRMFALANVQPAGAAPPSSSADAKENVINRYFGGTLSCTVKCKESDDEPMQSSQEEFLTLPCFISADVKYLQSGLKLKLVEEITKQSAVLGRDAVWEKTSKVSRLPAYLAVTLMRFFYKEKEKTNAKVLKDIKFQVCS